MKLALALFGLLSLERAMATGNECHVCKSKITKKAAGVPVEVDVSILHGCDLNFDGYDDIKMCFKIEDEALSHDHSETMIGVAFDMFEELKFPEGLKVSEIAILGPEKDFHPDAVCMPYPNNWIDENEVCTTDDCATKPTFKVSGGVVEHPYDVAVKFDSKSTDTRVHHACFLLSLADCSLPIWSLEDSDVYVKFIAAGESAKMIGKLGCGVAPPPHGELQCGPEPTPSPTPTPPQCPEDAIRCEKPGEKWKYSLFRLKDDGKCEFDCVEWKDLEKKLSEGYGCDPCYKTCSPEPERCEDIGHEWEYTLYRPKSDGSCEVKCEKANYLEKKLGEGFSCEPCPDTPPSGSDTCDVCGKPQYLAFQYDTDNCVGLSCNSQEPKGKSDVSGTAGGIGAEVVDWVTSGEEDCLDDIYDFGKANVGDLIVTRSEKFNSNMYICLSGSNGEQVIRFHASCSAPIVEGERFGYLTLVGYSSDAAGPASGCGFGGDAVVGL